MSELTNTQYDKVKWLVTRGKLEFGVLAEMHHRDELRALEELGFATRAETGSDPEDDHGTTWFPTSAAEVLVAAARRVEQELRAHVDELAEQFAGDVERDQDDKGWWVHVDREEITRRESFVDALFERRRLFRLDQQYELDVETCVYADGEAHLVDARHHTKDAAIASFRADQETPADSIRVTGRYARALTTVEMWRHSGEYADYDNWRAELQEDDSGEDLPVVRPKYPPAEWEAVGDGPSWCLCTPTDGAVPVWIVFDADVIEIPGEEPRLEGFAGV